MKEKQFIIAIGKQEYKMCFTLEALASAVDRYGDLTSMNTALLGKEDASMKDNIKLLTETAWMAAEMINAAQNVSEYETGKKNKPVTPEYIRSKLTLSEIQEIRQTVLDAVAAGLLPDTQECGDEETDFELQEINSKKNTETVQDK